MLLAELQRDRALQQVVAALDQGARLVLARYVPRPARGAVAAALHSALRQTCLVVVPDAETAEDVASDVEALLGAGAALVFPSRDLFVGSEAPDVRSERERLAVLEALARSDESRLLIAPVVALAEPTTPPALFRRSRFTLRSGEEVDRDLLAGQLVDAGFERVEAVEQVGQFSVRGGIVDVYPPSGEHPFRLEFFGDTIESIRTFELASQRSRETVTECLLSTPHEVVLTREHAQRAVTHVLARIDQQPIEDESFEADLMRDLSRLEGLSYSPGLERYLPLLYPERPTLLDHLPDQALVLFIERRALEQHLRRLEDEVRQSANPFMEFLGLNPAAWLLDWDSLLARAALRPCVFITVGEESDEPMVEEEPDEDESVSEEDGG